LNKRIAILGSTGSIGSSALEVIEHLGPPYRVSAISGHQSSERLAAQLVRHRPAALALSGPPSQTLRAAAAAAGARLYEGREGLVQMVQRDDVDVVLAAIVGAAGLHAVLAAVQAGKQLALANKEALVVAGCLLVPEARRRGVNIVPVDSEHSAVFQAMACGRLEEVRRVILTASGGPFRTTPLAELEHVSVEDALKHPTWRMGRKISIDSATMFNKALEIVEACWLFDLPPEKVEVVIHPESIVHSMVEFVDGSIMAQLSPPDMRTPIQYALTWPERRAGLARKLDLSVALGLHFEPPDPQRFKAIALAYEAVRRGGTMGAVMNAANEAAVAAFTSGKIRFTEIPRLVESTMREHQVQTSPTLDDLLAADRWARRHVDGLIECAAAAR